MRQPRLLGGNEHIAPYRKGYALMEQHPAVPLCHESYNYNEAVVDRLTAIGYEVESLKTYATK